MAYSASTGFRLRKSLYGGDLPAGQVYRAGNSATLKVGDAVRLNTSGFLVRCAAGDAVLGILTGFVAVESNASLTSGVNPFALGAPTAGATLTEDDQVATASDNTTRSEYIAGEVVVDPAGALLWYNDSNESLDATDDGAYFDVLAGANQIDAATVSDTSGQFQCLGRDPDGDADASKGLFRINENQLSNTIGNSTAVREA